MFERKKRARRRAEFVLTGVGDEKLGAEGAWMLWSMLWVVVWAGATYSAEHVWQMTLTSMAALASLIIGGAGAEALEKRGKGEHLETPFIPNAPAYPEPETPQPHGLRSRHITNDVKAEVMRRDNGTCVECGAKQDLQFGHIIPFSVGGSSTVDNIQVECAKCNLSKGATL